MIFSKIANNPDTIFTPICLDVFGNMMPDTEQFFYSVGNQLVRVTKYDYPSCINLIMANLHCTLQLYNARMLCDRYNYVPVEIFEGIVNNEQHRKLDDDPFPGTRDIIDQNTEPEIEPVLSAEPFVEFIARFDEG